MKNRVSFYIITLFILSINNVFASIEREQLAADFLSYKGIINTQENYTNYKLDQKITRREMAKITLKLSNISVFDKCKHQYIDLGKDDWGCKYAEAGLNNGFFAKNVKFNPNNNISKIESLKMIMKGQNITKDKLQDWKKGYVTAAVRAGLLEETFTDYDVPSSRGWIFKITQYSIEFSPIDEDINIIKDLLYPHN